MRLAKRWHTLLIPEFKKNYMEKLESFLIEEYDNNTIYPDRYDIFRSLQLTDYNDVKVVIIGQDPYHGKGQANGLAFAVNKDQKVPPSLRNIFKEINNSLGCTPDCPSLIGWAKQGVLLLNTVMSVRDGKPNSHQNKGWERFTDHLISMLNKRNEPIVFMFWGNHAKKKSILIDANKHIVLKAAHPSPLSANKGWFGCDHFKIANERLKSPIDWSKSGSDN